MPNAPRTRQSLLIELGRRSDDAWAEFLGVYEHAIVRYCRSLGLQDADARDATQEVLTAVHERVPTWEPSAAKGSFRAWLFRVARNVAVDAIAARARRTPARSASEVERTLAELADPGADHGAGLDTEYRRTLLEWAANEVRAEVQEVTWQAFRRTAVDGRPAGDVAAELGLPVGSVYTAKCRVVARIRDKVARLEDLPATAAARSPRDEERQP
ncbi:MAG: sigma-70 family RNA polymerase sigma factor [Planctomycetes bacterium]|nr:sigma-70 family RNA polymerase sigma factor [Planctomycetota bacterium]